MQCRDVQLQAVFPNHRSLYFFQSLLAVELAHERLNGRQFRTWNRKVTIRRDAAHGVNLFGTGAARIEQPHTHVVEQFRSASTYFSVRDRVYSRRHLLPACRCQTLHHHT